MISAQCANEASSYILYTRSVPIPTKRETVLDRRLLLRLAQVMTSLGPLFAVVFQNMDIDDNMKKTLFREMEFVWSTSVFCIFYSVCCMFVYFLPSKFGIPPHRHKRISPVEIMFDVLFTIVWFITSIISMVNVKGGYNSSDNTYEDENDSFLANENWLVCTTCGYVLTSLHLITVILGALDLRKYGPRFDPNTRTYAKCSWQKWKD